MLSQPKIQVGRLSDEMRISGEFHQPMGIVTIGTGNISQFHGNFMRIVTMVWEFHGISCLDLTRSNASHFL